MPKMTARPRARRRSLEGAALLNLDAELSVTPVAAVHAPPCQDWEHREVDRLAREWIAHRVALLDHDPDAGAWWATIERGDVPELEVDPRFSVAETLADQTRHHEQMIACARAALRSDRGAA